MTSFTCGIAELEFILQAGQYQECVSLIEVHTCINCEINFTLEFVGIFINAAAASVVVIVFNAQTLEGIPFTV
jgi:hypothetical protein